MATTYRIGVFASSLEPSKLTWCAHAKNPKRAIETALFKTQLCGKFMVFDWHCPPKNSALLLTVNHDDGDDIRNAAAIVKRLRAAVVEIRS